MAWASSIYKLAHLIMQRIARISATLVFLGYVLGSGIASGSEPCLIALDMGSSGIRAGAANSSLIERASFNALGLLDKTADVVALEAPTIRALDSLLHKDSFDTTCDRLGGGFSVWRRALEQDRNALVTVLQRIRAQTGVAVLVIPPSKEGQYAYIAAQQSLGGRLTTTHVMDIGGGSLQISSSEDAAGLPLGQKTWHQLLCQTLDKGESECVLEPLSALDLDRARKLASSQIKPLIEGMPSHFSLTAVSRPVTRGIKPYLDEVMLSVPSRADKTEPGPPIETSNLEIGQLSRAIDRAAKRQLHPKQTIKDFSRYLLSDMLLVEGIMLGAGLETLAVADIDLTNIPGLLNDARAYAWLRLYGCYLTHLNNLGVTAFDRNPGECRPLAY